MCVETKSTARPGLLGVVEQLLDPAGSGRRRAADGQPGVDRAHRGRGHVVQPFQNSSRRAGPEDLEVGLVPHLERPVVAHLLQAVAVDEVRDQVAIRSYQRSQSLGGDTIAP